MVYEEVLRHFEVRKKGYTSAQCICPVHGDTHASLTVTKADNDNTLIYCHVGCSAEDIVQAAGLKLSDLYLSQKKISWQDYVERTTKLQLESWYDYKDYQGKYAFTRLRLFPKTFRYGVFDAARERITLGLKGMQREDIEAFYSVSSIAAIKQAIDSGDQVFITEGEKDARTLHNNGLIALTFGSSDDTSKGIEAFLKGANVVLVSDYDLVGYECMVGIKEKIQNTARSVKIILPCRDKLHSDVTDYFEAGHTKEEFLGIVNDQIIDDEMLDTLRQIQNDAADKKAAGSNKKKSYISDRQAMLLEKLTELKPEQKYSLDDKGNGALFASVFSDEIRWNVTAKEFFAYDGKVWQQDIGGMIAARCAKELSDAISIYAVNIENEEVKQRYRNHINKLGQYKFRKTMLEDSKDCSFISASDLDSNKYILNVQNGVIDLETFEFKAHSYEQLLSKICNVTYDKAARSVLWENFIDEVMQGDKDKIMYLQKAIGYSLTGDTREETCFILYGKTTRNGKSTLVETIAYMLGDSQGYALNMKPESLAARQNNDSRQASGDIARLDNCRFLNASEPPKKMIFDVGLLKNLLGRDTITARHLHQSEFQFIPQFKLFINTNFLPLITDDTLFSSGRINVITFDRHFSEEEQDKTLKDKLREPEQLSGILNWCLDGLRMYRKDGLERPEAVKEATDEYRQDSDKLGNFIAERLEAAKSMCTSIKLVYEEYMSWCKDNGYGTENKGNFIADLRTKGIYKASGTINGVTVRNVVDGYIISSEFQAAQGYNSFEKN